MAIYRTLLVILLLSGLIPVEGNAGKENCPKLYGELEAQAGAKQLRFESGATYRVTPMGKRYMGEASTGDIYSAKYFREQSRRQFEVGVDGEGRLHWADGTLVNTCYPATSDCPAAIFVMGENGKIYVYNGDRLTKDLETIHHSSLLAGAPVASAGEITIVDGKVLLLNDRSGHYLPPPDIFQQVLEELKLRGVDLNAAEVSTH